MCRRERRSQRTPLVIASASVDQANTMVGYECTCGRRRCRCGASGGLAMDDGHGDDYSYRYGCGGRYRRRRQGPITALIGALVSLAEKKYQEKKAERAAIAAAEAEAEESSDDSDGSSDSDKAERNAKKLMKEKTQNAAVQRQHEQEQGVVPGVSPSQQQSEQVYTVREKNWEVGPPPYSA